MSSTNHASFDIIASNTFVGFPDGKIFSWCPRMELLAVSMNKTSIWVFRLNGERVYSINNRSEVIHLVWNQSGKFFGVSGADKFVKVYDSNNGALINTFATSTVLPITLTDWCSVCTFEDSSKSKLTHLDFFKVNTLGGMPKLGNEIDRIGSETKAFSSSTIQPVTNTNEDESVLDCLIVVNADALMSVTFDNLFIVPDIELPDNCKFLKHGVAGDMFRQHFLVEEENGDLSLKGVTLDMSVPEQKKHLVNIIRWSSMLVSITNHINEQFRLIVKEAQEFVTLFDRHLGNLKDSLYSEVDLTTEFPQPADVEAKIIDTFMHMLLSGLIPANLKDYWLNQFGERGLLKISSVGNSAFDNARKTLFSQIILALEKCIVILSNMEAVVLAETTLHGLDFGISLEMISKSIYLAKQLIKDFYEFIWEIKEELEAFNKMLNWLKVEVVDKLAKEESDPQSFFSQHSTMEFKASTVMDYFEQYLLDPAFLKYLPVNTSNNEVLNKSNLALDLQQSINELIETVDTQLLKGLRNDIRTKVKFKDSTTLQIQPKQVECQLNLSDSGALVTAAKGSKLLIIRVSGVDQQKLELDLGEQIISHEILNGNRIVVLYRQSEVNYKFELYRINFANNGVELSNSITFNQSTFIKTPAYMSISGMQEESLGIACVLDASRKQYVVLRL